MSEDTVLKFKDEELLRDLVDSNNFVVVNFTSWESIQTNQMNSMFTKLSKKHPKIKFAQIVKDEMPKTFHEWEVSKIPVVKFFNSMDNGCSDTCSNSDDLIKKVEAFSKQADADCETEQENPESQYGVVLRA
ncbi:hypothetical protein IWW56_005383 [Coemansia sp. RSA 2131]|nr:hypothetical protein IWW56_005383 [Coemansia sp. RSA 2131]